MSAATTRILFVCLGNICRSPTAHAVFEQRLAAKPWAARVQVDSAGTGDWHIGHAPDKRAQAAAERRGYRMAHLRARQVTSDDFNQFDWVLAMDAENLVNLQAIKPASAKTEPRLFLSLLPNSAITDVPDPYYGGEQGFETVLDLIEQASDALLAMLEEVA